MPLTTPSLQSISASTEADITARLAGASPLLRRSILGAIGRALSQAVFGLYGYLRALGRQVTPYTAEASDLEGWASLWKVFRKPATQASGAVLLTGTAGTLVPTDTALQSNLGFTFLTTADVTLDGLGTATASVLAVDAGIDGNQNPGDLLNFINPQAGVDSAATVDEDGLTGGADIEDDASLRARMLQRIQNPPHGGNAADYLGWALAVGPITRAWVFPLYAGAGTVRVYVANDAYVGANLAGAGEVSQAQSSLDALRPVTATVAVVAPTRSPVAFTLSINPDTAANRDAVSSSLAAVFQTDAEPEGAVRLNRLRQAVGTSGEVYDFDLTVPASNPTAAAGTICTLGTITWV